MRVELAAEEQLDGRYHLIRPLAEVTAGGHVFAAEHIHTKHRCAVKLLDANVSEKVRKRTAREMVALARAQGPGVVDFRDAGESDGKLYLVLELLEGRTLAGLLAAKGKLPVEQAVKVGVDIASALARCHERSVVHRDIKPANIFVTTAESVQLLDFGIAKIIDDDVKLEKLTQENTLVGTPEYMAPEALLMSPDVAYGADQYALAITLWECLTGTVPFEGGYAEVMRAVMTTAPPVEVISKHAPDSLVSVIKRALGREPHERFGSIIEMREALRKALPGQAAGMFEAKVSARHAIRDAATVADAPQALHKDGRTRRRHARAPYVTLARIQRPDDSHVDGRIEEVSESGFQFIGERPLANGETVRVRFALPMTGRITEATATTRWTRTVRGLAATGLEFTALPDDALGELRKYVSLMSSD